MDNVWKSRPYRLREALKFQINDFNAKIKPYKFMQFNWLFKEKVLCFQRKQFAILDNKLDMNIFSWNFVKKTLCCIRLLQLIPLGLIKLSVSICLSNKHNCWFFLSDNFLVNMRGILEFYMIDELLELIKRIKVPKK